MRPVMILALAAVALLAPTRAARADLIGYTFFGTASGSLDGQAFTAAEFAVTALSDTDDITAPGPGLLEAPVFSILIGIQGVGIVDPAGDFVVALDRNLGFVRLLDAAGATLLALDGAGLAAYDLASDFGPASSLAVSIDAVDGLPTDGGPLTFDSVAGLSFQARGGVAAPEPTSLALAALGGGLIVARSRRRAGADRG